MLHQEAEQIMVERFGGDAALALSTAEGNVPYVRLVNAHYEDGALYVITHARSNKMQQIARNPVVAIAGEWFTAHGRAESLGWFGKSENRTLAAKLETAFSAWIHNGHNDFDDPDTIILCIRLTDGVLLSHGRRFEL